MNEDPTKPWKAEFDRYIDIHDLVPRERDGFINPCGLRVRVVTGAGAGWQVTTLEKPAPLARV